MKHTEYVEFFRDIARTHPDLLHSDSAMHFGRLVITRDPLMGSQHQINEFLHNNGSKLKYPCMLLVAFRGDYADNRSDNKRKRMDGSYILLDKVREGDHDGEEDVYNRMETLGEEIASICIDHFDDNPGEGIFDVNVMENEKIAKVANDKFGVKFYFGIDKSADAVLSEPLPQEKINGIADPATYRNSDSSFSQEISAGSIYTARDVVHIDSTGEEAPTPANVAFVATPADLFGFAGAILEDDNSTVELYLTEAGYATALASGALEPADFNLTFNQNGGDATAASIASLEKIDEAVANEAGDIAVRAILSVSGTPSGVEAITINPVADSVFDTDGNAMLTSESVSFTLNQTYTAETIAYRDRVQADTGALFDIDKFDAEIKRLKSNSVLANLAFGYHGSGGFILDAANKSSKQYSYEDSAFDLLQATAANQPVLVNDAYNLRDALEFSQGQYISKSGFTIEKGYSLEIGFNIKSFFTAAQIAIKFGNNATGERRALLIWNGGSGTDYFLYSSFFGDNKKNPDILALNTEYKVVLTCDAAYTVKFYFDGVLTSSHAHAGVLPAANELVLGASLFGSGKEYFDGFISHFNIYNKVLTDTEVANLNSAL